MSEALTYDPIKPEAVAAIILMIVIGACAARFFMCLTFFCSPYSPCTDADEERLRILPAADGHADGLAGDDSGLRDNEWAATRPATFTGLPMQEAAKRYYRAILPLALLQVISLVLVCQILLPLGAGFTDAIVALILHPFVPAEDIVNGHRSPFEMVLVQMAFVLGVVLLPIGQVAPLPSIFRRLRKATEPAPKGTVLAAGQKKPGDVTARRPKRHVIVIPAYKEPIPVLTRTLDSLEYQVHTRLLPAASVCLLPAASFCACFRFLLLALPLPLPPPDLSCVARCQPDVRLAAHHDPHGHGGRRRDGRRDLRRAAGARR